MHLCQKIVFESLMSNPTMHLLKHLGRVLLSDTLELPFALVHLLKRSKPSN